MIKNALTHLKLHSSSCLAIERDFASAVKCSLSGNQIKITAMAIEYLDSAQTNQEPKQSIKRLLKKIKLSSHRLLTVSSVEQALIKEIQLPPLNLKDLKQALTFEIDNHIPFSQNDIYYGYTLLPKASASHSHVLIGVIPKNNFQQHKNHLNNWGLKQPIISLKPFAIASYYIHYSTTFQSETVLLIDIGPTAEISINIIEKGLLRFSKTIQGHEELLLGVEQNNIHPHWAHIFEDIESSITYFQTIQSGSRPSHIKVHALKDIPDILLEHICKNLQMQNVFIDHAIEREYIVPVGLNIAVLKKLPYLSIEPQETSLDRLMMHQKLINTILICVISLQLALLWKPFKIHSILKPVLKRQTAIRKQALKAKSVQKELQEAIQALDSNQEQTKSKPFVLHMFQDLVQYLPDQTHLLEIDQASTGKITLQGLCTSLVDIKRSLELCPRIQSLNLSELNKYKNNFPSRQGFQAHFYYSFAEGERHAQSGI